MPKPLRYALRFLAIVAVVVTVSALFVPASPANSPYLSALLDLSGRSVLAANHCANKTCGSFSGPCVSAPGYLCSGGGGHTQCFTKLCQ